MTRKWKLMLLMIFILIIVLSCNIPKPGESTGTPDQVNGSNGLPLTTPSAAANTDGAEVVYVPGGVFSMGSEDTDELANEDEMPLHNVTLGGFYIYTHEVTNEMYARCVDDRVCLPVHIYENGPTSHFEDSDYGDYPVVGVDWNMARAYCNWAGGRLPTEAEWELASRSNENLPYPWGTQEPSCNRVNMLGCSVPPDTMEVGSFRDGNSVYNGWDMSGNVWEWVNDWYAEGYYFLSAEVNPIGPYYGEFKVARGGGLYSEPDKMRSAVRAAANPYRSYDDVGFRCVPTGEAFPEELILPENRHETGSPDSLDGGGDRIDDPEGVPSEPPNEGWWWTWSNPTSTCPDTEGQIHFFISTETSYEVEYEVSYYDVPYSCEYDEGLRGLLCSGPVPEEGVSPYLFLIRAGEPLDSANWLFVTIPDDCPTGAEAPLTVDNSVSCPNEEGLVTLILHFEPSLSSIESVRIGDGVAACTLVSPNEIDCNIVGYDPGDPISIAFTGIYESGEPAVIGVFTMVPEDCSQENSISVSPGCLEGHQVAEVHFTPTDRELVNVLQTGVPIATCIGMAPGVQVCGNILGDPGSTTTISVCFAGESCIDFPITIESCLPTATLFDYSITSHCYPGIGPVSLFSYSPIDFSLTSATSGGTNLTCYDDVSHPGFYMCGVLPGDPGDVVPVAFCLSDGSCRTGSVFIPDCDVTGPVGFWDLVGVSCHEVTGIAITIGTPFSDLEPGMDWSYSVHTMDGERSYNCSIEPTVPGRIVCTGESPEVDSPLEICVTVEGSEEHCTSFDNFFEQVPVCELPPTEVPDEPGGETTEEPLPDCSSYSGPISCNADSRCYWYNPPSQPQGYCRTR